MTASIFQPVLPGLSFDSHISSQCRHAGLYPNIPFSGDTPSIIRSRETVKAYTTYFKHCKFAEPAQHYTLKCITGYIELSQGWLNVVLTIKRNCLYTFLIIYSVQ